MSHGRDDGSLPGLVHGHGEPELKVLEKHLSAERDSLAKHVHGHEAQGLAVHQESIGLNGWQRMQGNHESQPRFHVVSGPSSGIYKKKIDI